ncbi:hypothetical protein [Pseudanabaena sp. 'Roaring Creek']|uniref:hypothetical protein n=1 Tax=Pseudanabaena sp. 'Roaring Creek' TaxID=1681830 RepID=UPI0006D77FBA|nr:hypothetical protein [Pseudanabaena sp. 'Roaring Creek']
MSNISQSQSKSISSCINYISIGYKYIHGRNSKKYIDLFTQIARQVLETIAKCDAPYHNLDHTLQVVLTGQEILYGKSLCEEPISPTEWIDFIVSLLCHDIGYVKGICSKDSPSEHKFATGIGNDTVIIDSRATGASLTPYHVDRGKLFVEETLSNYDLIDVKNIQLNIEFTRFPVSNKETYKDTIKLPGLARAADLIGQLSDSTYLSKLPALFSEFEEVGNNKNLGYSSASDLRAGYPRFYWHCVSTYLHHSIRYLEVSTTGKAILLNMYNNRDTVEKELERLYSDNENIFNRLLNNIK